MILSSAKLTATMSTSDNLTDETLTGVLAINTEISMTMLKNNDELFENSPITVRCSAVKNNDCNKNRLSNINCSKKIKLYIII